MILASNPRRSSWPGKVFLDAWGRRALLPRVRGGDRARCAPNNTLALYFATTESFHVGVIDAGIIASLFGWMNLFARSSGGIASDLGNKVSGMRGRLIAQSLILIIEGILLIIFARQNHIRSAIPCLVAWSFFVQAAEGATFGIVPYVCPEGLGGVCAVVGAWGNIGAVAWGMMFKFGYIGNFEQGYIAMGYIIIASSVFTIFMRIKGQSSVLCGDQ